MNTVIMVIAIIAGPILAIRVQKLIERFTQRRDEKRRLFMTLMATRGRPLVPEHVQELNLNCILPNPSQDQNLISCPEYT